MIAITTFAMCACCQEELSTYLDEHIKTTQAAIDCQYVNYPKNKDEPRRDMTVGILCGVLAGFNTVKLHYEDPSCLTKTQEETK